MTTGISYDLGQLETFVKRLDSLTDAGAPLAIVEGLADHWVQVARFQMGYDSGKLWENTKRTRSSGTRTRAEAYVIADREYAGFHNYGTRFQGPNRFWDNGLEAAEMKAGDLGGAVDAQIRRVLGSGGSWDPHTLF